MVGDDSSSLQRALSRGAECFDRGDFFEAHEVWEERWRASHDERERLLLQGLIQVAAAFHKFFVMHAPESTRRLLARGLDKLERAGSVEGVNFDLPAFRAALGGCGSALAAGTFGRSGVPRLRLP